VNGLFITGTDTGVGKTWICGYLAGFLRAQGVRVVTQKWVQTGCAGYSEDLARHQQLSGFTPDPALAPLLNPYCFPFPASPHLASAREGVVIEAEVILSAYRALAAQFELVLVEGAGGVCVPLTDHLLTIDLVARLHLPAVVVVRNGLGCINHALLTLEALRARQIPLLGLIVNHTSPDGDARILQDNPRIIEQLSGVPVLGSMPYLPIPDAEAFAPIGAALWGALPQHRC